MDRIVKVAEDFYRYLYNSRDNQNGNGRGSSPEELYIPLVTKEEVKKALEAMQRGKGAGEVQMTAYVLKDGGQLLQEKLAALYTQCLKISTVPESWKHANIILLHKKGYV